MGTDGVNRSQSRPSGRFDSTGGVLEILDGRVNFEHVRKVLSALRSELIVVNTETMAILGVRGIQMVSMGADGVNHSQLWVKGLNGELRGGWAAYLTLVSVLLSLSMSAMCLAPSDPTLFESTL